MASAAWSYLTEDAQQLVRTYVARVARDPIRHLSLALTCRAELAAARATPGHLACLARFNEWPRHMYPDSFTLRAIWARHGDTPEILARVQELGLPLDTDTRWLLADCGAFRTLVACTRAGGHLSSEMWQYLVASGDAVALRHAFARVPPSDKELGAGAVLAAAQSGSPDVLELVLTRRGSSSLFDIWRLVAMDSTGAVAAWLDARWPGTLEAAVRSQPAALLDAVVRGGSLMLLRRALAAGAVTLTADARAALCRQAMGSGRDDILCWLVFGDDPADGAAPLVPLTFHAADADVLKQDKCGRLTRFCAIVQARGLAPQLGDAAFWARIADHALYQHEHSPAWLALALTQCTPWPATPEALERPLSLSVMREEDPEPWLELLWATYGTRLDWFAPPCSFLMYAVCDGNVAAARWVLGRCLPRDEARRRLREVVAAVAAEGFRNARIVDTVAELLEVPPWTPLTREDRDVLAQLVVLADAELAAEEQGFMTHHRRDMATYLLAHLR